MNHSIRILDNNSPVLPLLFLCKLLFFGILRKEGMLCRLICSNLLILLSLDRNMSRLL